MKTEEINKQEVYRYLGYRGGARPDGETANRIDGCIAQIAAASQPRKAVKRMPLVTCPDEEDTLLFGGMRVKSRNLSHHLAGCTEIVVFAATVGIGVDRLIKRASISGMADAAILQAAGAAAVEAVCDRIEEEINHTAAKDGLKARHRFSPGYGDFALSHQPEVLSMVNATKLTGITLTDGYLMVPSKSVTAVIGLYHEDTGNSDTR